MKTEKSQKYAEILPDKDYKFVKAKLPKASESRLTKILGDSDNHQNRRKILGDKMTQFVETKRVLREKIVEHLHKDISKKK